MPTSRARPRVLSSLEVAADCALAPRRCSQFAPPPRPRASCSVAARAAVWEWRERERERERAHEGEARETVRDKSRKGEIQRESLQKGKALGGLVTVFRRAWSFHAPSSFRACAWLLGLCWLLQLASVVVGIVVVLLRCLVVFLRCHRRYRLALAIEEGSHDDCILT